MSFLFTVCKRLLSNLPLSKHQGSFGLLNNSAIWSPSNCGVRTSVWQCGETGMVACWWGQKAATFTVGNSFTLSGENLNKWWCLWGNFYNLGKYFILVSHFITKEVAYYFQNRFTFYFVFMVAWVYIHACVCVHVRLCIVGRSKPDWTHVNACEKITALRIPSKRSLIWLKTESRWRQLER